MSLIQGFGEAEAAFGRVLGQPFGSATVDRVLEEPSLQTLLRTMPWFAGSSASRPGAAKESLADAAICMLTALAKVSRDASSNLMVFLTEHRCVSEEGGSGFNHRLNKGRRWSSFRQHGTSYSSGDVQRCLAHYKVRNLVDS